MFEGADVEQYYMDFEDYAYYRAHGVIWYWASGTGLTCLSLAVGLVYIVIEYCTQSHLSTEDYESAKKGLRMTRWFKRYTAWLRTFGRFLAECMHTITRGIFKSNSKSLVWDWMTRDQRIRATRTVVVDGEELRC